MHLRINPSKSSIHLKNIAKIYLQLPKKHKVVISSFSILLMLMLLIPSEKATASKQSTESVLQIGKRYQIDMPLTSATKARPVAVGKTRINQTRLAIEPNLVAGSIEPTPKQLKQTKQKNTWQTTKVRNGDSLAKIFKRLGFNSQTTYKVSTAKGKDSKLLKKLNVGDTLRIASNEKGQLVALDYAISKTKILHVTLKDSHYRSETETKTVEIREAFANGVISSSFWNAAVDAGLDDGQIINLANVFGWDIDFALDIRAGDSFHVVYENRYIDGEYIGHGNILAAEFINQDDPFQAIRFSDGEYYSADGKSMRKAFLRAPVNFKYISSNFKRKRFHPVQKRWKAHRGTDYAAKTGTPVVAAGNGKVVRATYDKYNGHHVFIQHGNGIETKYIHFSKRAVKKGQRVKQGQVIGYVGATGLAAGPHLHYEFLLNGIHRNPRTVKLPDAHPINKKFRTAFNIVARKRLSELSGSKMAMLSMQSTESQTSDD
jgi:murein DD-endopeptidase MepM/ murein hydrolase activator NlpD